MNESTTGTLANARYTRVKLWPRGPFHFGKRGVGLNETEIAMPADSFFSALCNAIHGLQGTAAVAEFIARFPSADRTEQAPPLRITSLMPFVEPGAGLTPIYLLPMPLLHIPIGKDPIGQRKQMKQIQWVSHAIFAQIISGHSLLTAPDKAELLENAHDEVRAKPRTVQQGSVWLSRSEYNSLHDPETRFWSVGIRPRVAVDRITGASAVYSSGSVNFAKNAGLYLYIEWLAGVDVAVRQQVQAAITYLGDSGIGGERTYGYGQYSASFEDLQEMPIQQPSNATHVTTLSPFLPKPSERTVLMGDARYEIILRRGWLTLPGYSNLRRPTVRMVDVGAILSTESGVAPQGYLANATPQPLQNTAYTIHRYGLCWPVAVVPQFVH
ncbi:MAG: type III-A CRISPR-associated RAMP protein Csm4 [Caldilineaceae bacterium]